MHTSFAKTMTVNHTSYWILLTAFSLANKHKSHTGGVCTCMKMLGIFWLTQFWHSIQLARNVMLCMRKAHLLWSFRYCLVLTTFAETNHDNDHTLLCMNNCTFHAFVGVWERKTIIAEGERHPPVCSAGITSVSHTAYVFTAGPRYSRDNKVQSRHSKDDLSSACLILEVPELSRCLAVELSPHTCFGL